MRSYLNVRVGDVAAGARAAVVALLCVTMAGQPLFAAAPVKKTVAATEIKGGQRALHALNRLTFGPRPGDLAAVQTMGLDAWFERQLNPASIDDSALDVRLEAFPAMQLSQEELMRRFPNPAVIRQIARGQLSLPGDPILRAVYADQVAFYNLRTASQKGTDGAPAQTPQKKKGVNFGNNPADVGGMDGDTMKSGKKADPEMAMAQEMPMDGKAAADLAKNQADPLAVAPDEHLDNLYAEDAAQGILANEPTQRLQAILSMKPTDLAAFRRSLSKRELVQLAAGMTPAQKETLLSLGGSQRVVAGEVLQTRLLRDIYSDRQLEAVMTDFWLNHFNVYVRKNQVEPYLLPSFERDVVRPRALGSFEDLLVATAKSPAMLEYLDNAQSFGPNSQQVRRVAARAALMDDPAKRGARGLNENYGRELMELHTLGVNGGYTQADVTQVAKVFTGWTVGRPYVGAEYSFEPNRHEPGAKTVLGKTIAPNGENEGLEVLHMLATSPATAKFISTKLAVRFVSDNPPAALVDRMAASFLASGGDIKTVLRTMFHSPEFWSPSVYKAKVKTPLEFVVSAVRASGVNINNAQPLVQSLDKLGMPLFGMQTPNGYSWKSEPWVSTGALVSRMNFALVFSGDRLGGVRTAWPALLASENTGVKRVSATVGASPDAEKERKLETILLGEPVSDRTRATVLAQFNDPTTKANAEKDFNLRDNDDGAMRVRRVGPQDAQAAGMAGLLLGSPEFQRR
jgi:uncharacterized protein (DUF1800 family)